MADFGVNATTLSAPQGAGSQTLAPVNSPRQVESGNGLMMIGKIFAKGLEDSRKDEADNRRNTVVGQYIEEENKFSQAVEQGVMTAAQAASRSRANFRQFSSSYSEYIIDFEKAGKALRGFTAIGVAVDEEQAAKEARKADKARAAGQGFLFLDGMSKEAEDAVIKASQAAIASEKEMSRFYAAKVEERAAGQYDAAVNAREEKELSFRVINTLASENLNAFQAFGVDVASKVKVGQLSPDEGRALLTKNFSNINAAIQAGARTNPELAAPYRSLFDNLLKTSMDMLDPKNQTAELEERFKNIKLKMKLIAMGDPEIAGAVVTNELFPNNPTITLSVSSASAKAFTKLSNLPIGARDADGSATYVPQVVGNPEVEEGTLKLLRHGLADLAQGKLSNAEVAKIQASNSINQILHQTGELINRGVSPKQLKGVAQFFASPEYAGFVANNKIDKQAAGAAARTFERLYQPAIINGVQAELGKVVPKGPQQFETSKEPVTFGEMIDIKFSGSGIYFEPKGKEGVSPFSQRQVGPVVKELNTAQKAINQLIHIAAHMEGSTDYGKFWEANKHIWIPSMFSAPEKAKEEGPTLSAAEKQMKEDVSDLPSIEEILNMDNTPSNIKALQKEIDRAKNPKVKGILEDYLKRLKEG